jgi:hypothetical protein
MSATVPPYVRVTGKPHLHPQQTVRGRVHLWRERGVRGVRLFLPRPTNVDLGARARRRQRMKVQAATWAVPVLLALILLWLVVTR